MALGIPVGELHERMSSAEFREWIVAYRRLRGPFGSEQFYLGVSMVCAAIYNSQRTKKSDPVITPDVFMPKFYMNKAEREEEQEGKLSAFLAGIGAPLPTAKKEEE